MVQRFPAIFGNSSSLAVVVNDKSDESVLYNKALALQHWLFGYELPGTVLVFAKNALWVLGSAKKSTRPCRSMTAFAIALTGFSSEQVLQQLGESGLGCELHFLIVNKEDQNAANFAQLVATVRACGVRSPSLPLSLLFDATPSPTDPQFYAALSL